MLRKDGIYEIYMIQHQQKDSKWVYSIFGTPTVADIKKGFNASGDCWQITGIEGTFDFETAKEGLIKASENILKQYMNGDLKQILPLRLVKVIISQTTSEVIFTKQKGDNQQ